MVKENKNKKMFLWGIICAVIVFGAISWIILYHYQLTPRIPVEKVSCDIPKQFSGCSDLLNKVEGQANDISNLQNNLNMTQAGWQGTQKSLDELKTSTDKVIDDAKVIMQKQSDIMSSELTQCNLIRQKLENVCDGYVCKGGSGFVYSAGSTAGLSCPKIDLTTTGALTDTQALGQVLGTTIRSSFNNLKDVCRDQYYNLRDCVQHYD